MRVEVGPMTAGDAQGVGMLHHRAWVDIYAGTLPPEFWDHRTVRGSVARWRGLLLDATPRRVLRVVAHEGKRVVGFAVRGPSRDKPGVEPARPTEVWSICVDRSLHGGGVGQGLLERCLAPGEPAEVWVWSGNERAVAFYRRNGFEADGRTFIDERFPQLVEIRMVR
jgi:ribosomal protein S18 acetylase RimI-like enzyme